MGCGHFCLPGADLDIYSHCIKLLPVFLEGWKVGIPTKARTPE